MFNKPSSKPQNRIDTLIGINTRVDGNIRFNGGLRVDGEINGNITAEPDSASTLVISEHGEVNGQINVTHLVSNGKITGPVHATEYLELQSKANIVGDVAYKKMEIHLDATIIGKLTHLDHAGAGTGDRTVALKHGNAVVDKVRIEAPKQGEQA
jgi:cytoskeletal protein CcmA (bactofilin family)